MTDLDEGVRFKTTGTFAVPPRELFRVRLAGSDPSGDSKLQDSEIEFTSAGWFEILLTVQWDSNDRMGRRFAHTAIPDSHPLHSEAIEADVLADLSDGRQLLRGNTIFDPSSPVRSLALEVWQDSPTPTTIIEASIEIRRLRWA